MNKNGFENLNIDDKKIETFVEHIASLIAQINFMNPKNTKKQ